MNDIVVDTSVMRLFGRAKDQEFRDFFRWLKEDGTLTVSQYLLNEYYRVGSNDIWSFLNDLITFNRKRYNRIDRGRIDSIDDKHFRYRCNTKDRVHVKLVMVSFRRLALSQDRRFVYDVNNFPGYQAIAARKPNDLPYKTTANATQGRKDFNHSRCS